MHPRAHDLIRDLPDEFEIGIEPDGKLAISYQRHRLALCDPDRERVAIEIALLVETDEGECRANLDLTELAQAFHNLAREGLRVTDQRVEPIESDDRGKSVHLVRLEGEGIAPGFLLAVIISAWGWSLPTIERRCTAKT